MYRHAWLIKLGLDRHPVHATKLINDYIHSRLPNSLTYAHQLFDQVPHKDSPLYTSLITAHTRSKQPEKALHLFSLMLRDPNPNPEPKTRPNDFVFTSVARAICSLPEYLFLGETLHAWIVKSGFLPGNVVLETGFLDMYAKCGLVECAVKVFDGMPSRNLVTWNAMVSGYIQNEMAVRGLEFFYRMKCYEFYLPDEYTVASVLSACASLQDLVMGMQVHGYAIVSGSEASCLKPLGNMYLYCGSVPCAEEVLSGIEVDVAVMLIKIRGYVFNNMHVDALKFMSLEENVVSIFYLDYTVIVPLLTACANLSLLKVGKQVHGLLITLVDYSSNTNLLEVGAIIGSALIDMYGKCGNISEARKVFDNLLPRQGVPHWNSMISTYMQNGLVEDAKMLLEKMPDKNVVSFTCMMTGYAQKGMPQEGLNLLSQMYYSEEGIRVDGNCLTFVVGLEACSHLTDLDKGKQIHAKIIRTLANADVCNVVVGTALVDMYSKSGNLHYARKVFDSMTEKNVVTWTSIIIAFAVHGLGFYALEIFQQMMAANIKPNEVTFIGVLTACSHCGLVDEGLQYFELMRRKYNVVPVEDHYTCLIDMLGRAGRLEEAWDLVEEIGNRQLGNKSLAGTIWSALLGACHLHGNIDMGKRVANKITENKKLVSSASITLSNVYAGAGMWNDAYRVRKSTKTESVVDSEPGLSRLYAHVS